MSTKRLMFTEETRFNEEELKAKLQELTNENKDSVRELLQLIVPTAKDRFMDWIITRIGGTVAVAAEAYSIYQGVKAWATIIENAMEYDTLYPYLETVSKGNRLIVYTDVYEWTSGSGNSTSYITEPRYVIR